MENLERILRDHPFTRGMTSAQLSLLAGCAANVVFPAGRFLFREGEDANSFYFIRAGRVIIETHVPPRGAIAIQTREAGEVTGWSWMIPPFKWHFDARAVEQTRAIALDGKCLRGKCEEDHDLGYELMKRFSVMIAQRLEATRLQLLDIYGSDKH